MQLLWDEHYFNIEFVCFDSRILCDTGDADKPDYIKHLKTVLSDEKATISDIIITVGVHQLFVALFIYSND